jgi:hypothetical protein
MNDIWWFIDNKLRNPYMFTICFNVVLPSLNRKCIITDPKISINENKKIKDIQ